jgi:hypothetical protein
MAITIHVQERMAGGIGMSFHVREPTIRYMLLLPVPPEITTTASLLRPGSSILSWWWMAMPGRSLSFISMERLVSNTTCRLSAPPTGQCAPPMPPLHWLEAMPDGGTFSGLGVNNNIFNPGAAGVGVQVITYQYLNACDTVSCTFNITVKPSETPLFSPFPDICAGDPAPVLPPISNNGIPGTWSPAVVSTTVTGTYVFAPALPCVESVSVTINVSSGGAPVFAWNAYPSGGVGANVFTSSQGSCSMTASVSGTEWVNPANNATPPTAPYYTTAIGTGLHLRHNWSSTNPNPTTTLTLNFSPPINDPSFTLFDINRNGANAICVNLWTDKVTVSGFSNATPILPAFTQVNPAHQTITQVGNSLLMVGNETSFNDVNVSFNGAITRIVITYTSESTISSSVGCPAGSGNPTTQFITVGSIRGVPVAEPTWESAGIP